jgi:uncharacterized protein
MLALGENAMKWTIALVLLMAGLAEGSCMQPEMNGKKVSEIFKDKQTAQLATAACEGNSAKINALIKAKAPINYAGSDGSTPLLWAISCKNEKGVEALLKAGANPNQHANESVENVNPVTAAASYSNPELLRLVLKYGGNPNSAMREDQDSALSIAFSLGNRNDEWTNYYMLLDAKADINWKNSTNWTIADEALAQGYPSKIIELLDRGFNQDLEKIAEGMYSRPIAVDYPEFMNRGIVLRMLRDRGVDIKKAKQANLDMNHKVGVELDYDMSFERELDKP